MDFKSKLKQEAEKIGEKVNGKSFVILRQAGESGQLYGSVSTRDIADIITAGGFTINRNQVVIQSPIKSLGLHNVPLHLHAEIDVSVTINVARSADEADRQARGESLNIVEETSMADLGLEVGAALEETGGSLGDR